MVLLDCCSGREPLDDKAIGAWAPFPQGRPSIVKISSPAGVLTAAPFSHDFVLVRAGAVSSPGAFTALRHAAQSSPGVGLVCALSNRAGDLRLHPNPGETAASMNHAADAPVELEAPFPEDACVYLKQAALAACKPAPGAYEGCTFALAHLAHAIAQVGGRAIAATDAYVLRLDRRRETSTSDADRFAAYWGRGLPKPALQPVRQAHARRRNPHWLTARETRLYYQGHARELRQDPRLDMEVQRFSEHMKAPIALERPSGAPLRVAVLVHALTQTGGVLSACMLVNDLIRLGVQAQLAVRTADGCCPDLPLLTEPVFFANGRAVAEHFPPCDVAVATHWTTMYYVARAFLRRPRFIPAYFVQDFELRFLDASDEQGRALAEQTYRMTPYGFAKSRWIGGHVQAADGSVAQVPPAIDLDLFRPATRPADPPLRVLTMLRPSTPRRGFETAAKVLRRLAQSHPTVELHSFGCAAQDLASRNVPGTHHGEVPNGNLPTLYQQAALFLECSEFHGFGRTAAEALACGTPVVATRSGGVEEFVRHEENGLLADVDAETLHDHCTQLLDDAALRARLSQAARPSVASFERLHSAKATLALFAQWLAAQDAATST